MGNDGFDSENYVYHATQHFDHFRERGNTFPLGTLDSTDEELQGDEYYSVITHILLS